MLGQSTRVETQLVRNAVAWSNLGGRREAESGFVPRFSFERAARFTSLRVKIRRGRENHPPNDAGNVKIPEPCSKQVKALPTDQDRSGRSFDHRESELLEEVLRSGVLFAPKGSLVKGLERSFAARSSAATAVACSSGSAAIHAALAAVDPEPGDEVITTAITDMGALTPILYQGAIPVFADVDAATGNVTAETIEACLSDRTRAIIATHLFGNPCDIARIAELAAASGVDLIEDCAQAFDATFDGKQVGSFGIAACFSLQQGKHITCGEGGLATSPDKDFAGRMRTYVNKAWDYDNPSDHDFLALNYRMSELQGAVTLAQLEKLDEGVATRRANAARLDEAVAGVPGIRPTLVYAGASPSYWRYCVLVDGELIPDGPDALAAQMGSLGVPAAARYIKKPAFQCGIFRNQKTFGNSRWPFTLARPEALDYSRGRFPGTFEFLDHVVVIPWNEKLTPDDVDRIAAGLSEGVAALAEAVA